MKKSEFVKKYLEDIKSISPNGDLQLFNKKCGCKNSQITEKDIAKKTSISNTNSCDYCNKTFSYQALPYFEFRCDSCGKIRILCITEDSTNKYIEKINEKCHKDDNDNECDGKISFSRLQNFELKCDNCYETKILYITENEAKDKKRHKCGGNITYHKLNAEFVMPTFWDHHWDKLENFRYNKDRYGEDKKQTSFTIPSIFDNILDEILTKEGLSYKDKIATIFLKRRHEHCPVSIMAWKGYVYDFHNRVGEYNNDGKERIHFKVEIQERIYVPEEYAYYRDGWYRFVK